MPEDIVANVQVPVTAQDQQEIASMIEDSPFPRPVLLKLALRIGIVEIRKDPTVLMAFLAKKSG